MTEPTHVRVSDEAVPPVPKDHWLNDPSLSLEEKLRRLRELNYKLSIRAAHLSKELVVTRRLLTKDQKRELEKDLKRRGLRVEALMSKP